VSKVSASSFHASPKSFYKAHYEFRGVYGVRLRSSIFCCRTCVYSKIFRDVPLVGPNAISKKSNNVVISSPRVFMVSRILVPNDSFPCMWSRDLEASGLAARGRQNFFFKLDFLGNCSNNLRNFFRVVCPPKGAT